MKNFYKYCAVAAISVFVTVGFASASHAWPLCSSKKGTACTGGDITDKNQYKCAAGRNGKKGTKCLKCEVSGDVFVWSGPYKCDSSLPVINKDDADKDAAALSADLLGFTLDILEFEE